MSGGALVHKRKTGRTDARRVTRYRQDKFEDEPATPVTSSAAPTCRPLRMLSGCWYV